MNTSQIIDMLRLQDDLNKRINPDWIRAKHPWHIAVMAECTEFIDAIGWKWWKHQTPDLEAAKSEAVDIWHFLLSMHLVHSGGSLITEASIIADAYCAASLVVNKPISVIELASRISILSAHSANFATPEFFILCAKLDMMDELYSRYIAKNVLNVFRQDNGYGNGTYRLWDDTKALSDIILKEPGYGAADLRTALAVAYERVVVA